ncbi:DsbA family protein [Plantactinospora sp. B6F1]|uniref:thioredoxin domain-containing protein n=1 Tax=Plantactinospora sp. B6F1 TaxID=3158971 RepID=UPI001A91FA31
MTSRETRRAQAAVAARRGRRINWALAVGGLVIAGLVIAIGFAVFDAANQDEPPARAGGALVTPANLTPTGAIPVGQPGAPVTVEIYLDYMCPACGKFEQANGGELDRLVRAGTARVELRPISFLDRTSQGSRYSSRAANAIATVADRAPDRVWALHSAFYDDQPREGTRGLTDQQIADLAIRAGVGRDVVDAFDERVFEPWVAKVTRTAFDSGVQGTPTVRINGTVFEGDVYRAGPLTEAVEAAARSGT